MGHFLCSSSFLIYEDGNMLNASIWLLDRPLFIYNPLKPQQLCDQSDQSNILVIQAINMAATTFPGST